MNAVLSGELSTLLNYCLIDISRKCNDKFCGRQISFRDQNVLDNDTSSGKEVKLTIGFVELPTLKAE